MKVDKNYFPGFTRKSITFTIDDGNIPLDKKFIDIVKPHGIKGTFNLCAPNLKKYSADFYREMYAGFGISNHCKYHPFAETPDKWRELSEEKFDAETADKSKIYKTDYEGLYHFSTERGWRKFATDEAYCRLVDECKAELEAVFGEGSVTTFVWPFCEQMNPVVNDYVVNKSGNTAVRRSGSVGNSTAYAVPEDRKHWGYNAKHNELLECARDYEAFADDGELKFFCFGVHAHDFENNNMWHVLEEFAITYGDRENDFWYASVEEIFAYKDASDKLIITETSVENPTDIDLYIKIDGKPTVVKAGERIGAADPQ